MNFAHFKKIDHPIKDLHPAPSNFLIAEVENKCPFDHTNRELNKPSQNKKFKQNFTSE